MVAYRLTEHRTYRSTNANADESRLRVHSARRRPNHPLSASPHRGRHRALARHARGRHRPDRAGSPETAAGSTPRCWSSSLGFDRGRITIPVRDDKRQLIGMLRYQPWPNPGEPKMLATAGSRRALLPHPAAEPSTQVLLVEGEPDMIAARSHGLPAIAVPGVDSWRTSLGTSSLSGPGGHGHHGLRRARTDGRGGDRERPLVASATCECSTSRPTGTTATTSPTGSGKDSDHGCGHTTSSSRPL